MVEDKLATQNVFSKLIFLPFNEPWAYFIALTTLLNVIINIIHFFFQYSTETWSYIYYAFEFFFLVNIIGLLIHRYMPKQRRSRTEEPIHPLHLLLNIISVLPYYEIHYLLHLHTWNVYKPVDFYRIKVVLRIISVYLFFKRKTNSVGINHVAVVIMQHLTRVLVISVVLSCVWYLFACFRCGFRNWTHAVPTDTINVNNSLHWWITSFHITSSIVAHNWMGRVLSDRELEWIFIIFSMLLGFSMHLMIFLGELTALFSHLHIYQFNFTTRIKKTMDLLKDWNVDQKIQRKVIDYYEFFWEKRKGEKKMPLAFFWLPVTVQRAVALDIFWDALRHSHLLTITDMSFKKSIAMVMRSEFMLPGDYIYKAGEIKSKMFYIVSGVVQVLSSEDNESPYLSLSAGTLLGEFNIFRPIIGTASVKCATFCEFHTLKTTALVKILAQHRLTAQMIHGLVLSRTDSAKKLYSKTRYLRIREDNDVSMKRFKHQWRAVHALHINKKEEIQDSLWQQLDKTFYSAYLDFMVLSEEVELKIQAICLTSQCPLIMEPQSSFRHFCDWIVLICICVQFILIPKVAFFDVEVSPQSMVYLSILDMTNYFDIYLQLTTAINLQSQIISKCGEIFLHRIVQFTFLIDVVASFPYPLLVKYVGLKDLVLLSTLPRVIKIYKLFVLIDEKLKSPFRRNIFLKIIKYVLLHLITIYLFSTGYYAIACFKNLCIMNSWFSQFRIPSEQRFSIAIYHISSVYLGVGVTDVISYLLTDVIYRTIMIYFAYFLFTTSIADITASVVLSVRKGYAHQDEIQMVDHIMKQRSIDMNLRKRLMKILNFNWRLNEGSDLYGPHGILRLSEKLKADTYTERIMNTLKLVPLFQSFEPQVVKLCAAHMKISVLPPGTHLMNAGILTMTVYVIVRGKCSMTSDLPGDKERKSVVILKRGDMLAPLELLHRLKSFVTIQTITAVEILELPYETFQDIIKSHPLTNEPLQMSLTEHIEKFQNTLYKKGCRLPPMISVIPALGGVDSFSYTVYKRKLLIIDEYTKAFLEMKHWSWLRYVLLRRTIDPKGKFFITWEAFRITTILVDITLGLLTANLLSTKLAVVSGLVGSFCFVAAVDVYVRLHCQYYNNDGILITHPLYTAKHYIGCSFPIDIIQTLPQFLLRSAYVFGSGNIMQTKALLRICLRSLQIYRFYKSMTYLESLVTWWWGSLLIKAKYTVFLIGFLLAITNILMILTCSFVDVTETEFYINCSGRTWITTSSLPEILSTNTVFIQTLYYVVCIYAGTLTGIFGIGSGNELTTFIILMWILSMVRWIVISGFTSCTTGGGINLANYQARMKQFLKFAKDVRLRDHLIKETVAHNEMVWKLTQGSNIAKICSKFNPFLRSQFICFLYESTLRVTRLMLNSSEPFLLAVAQRVQEVHYKAGADVIRCNDVQAYIYVVYTGLVEISVASCQVCLLEKGGVFGCFSATNGERQMISAKAITNITLLAIKSKEFHRLLQYWKNESAEEILNVILSTRQEYNISLMCTVPPEIFHKKYLRSIKGHLLRYHKYLERFNRILPVTGMKYKYWKYIVCVHISFITSTASLLNLCINIKTPTPLVLMLLFSLSDVIFAINLLIGFSMYYQDPYSGVLEKIGKNIAIKYLKSYFTFDLLICFPFEQIGSLFMTSGSKLFGINRIIRYYYLVDYYNQCNAKLTVSKHLRWTYLLYKTLFYIQLTANVWLIFGCDDGVCRYVYNIVGRPTYFIDTKSIRTAIIVTYALVISMFSSTGLRLVCPHNTNQLIIILIVSYLIQYIIATIISGFATLIMIERSIMMKYQHEIDILKQYLKGRDLSPPIFKLVWEYLLQLWNMQRGEWVPKALYDAPSYLKQDIMKSLYMQHIESHYLFENTHIDFLRQLVIHLKRCIYLPGNYIVESGDVDSAIYFIHKGEVAAYMVSGDEEIQCYFLSANMSFGENQGLQKIPYQHSYKAITTVEILVLKKESWDYLVTHFPASYELIQAKSLEYGLRFQATYAGKTGGVAVSLNASFSLTQSL
nr:uncharacterized protein LOC111423625 [Onthophagus taurus]